MAGGSGSTALRILLGTQLRRLREQRGITPQDAAAHIRGSVSKISRMELGRHPFKERDLIDLLRLYGVTDDAELDQLLALGLRANEPGIERQSGARRPWGSCPIRWTHGPC